MVNLKVKFIDLKRSIFPNVPHILCSEVTLTLARFLPNLEVYIFKNLFSKSVHNMHICSCKWSHINIRYKNCWAILCSKAGEQRTTGCLG